MSLDIWPDVTKQQISTSMHLTAECLFVFPFGRCRLGFSLSFLNKLTPPYLILFRLQRNSRELFASLQVRHWIHTWYTLSFSCSIKMVRYFILCLCMCVFCSQAGPSLVADLRRTSWQLRKGRHPSLYPAFPLEVFQVASFLLFSPQ